MPHRPKTYVGRSTIHGRGLFAAVPIKQGAYIGALKGPPAKEDGIHVLWLFDEEGNYFGRRGRNALRYVNHDTNPNAEFDDFDLYALRDIYPDEEITIDYGW